MARAGASMSADVCTADVLAGIGQRFIEKVDIPSLDPSVCWPWTASKNESGYGHLRWASSIPAKAKAHRIAWLLYVGDLPGGPFPSQRSGSILVCHHCDHEPCVRPSHLFLGSHQDNSLDASRKGHLAQPHRIVPKQCRLRLISRASRNAGETNGNAKHSDELVSQIRLLYSVRDVTTPKETVYRDIARRSGIPWLTVRNICTGQRRQKVLGKV